GTENTERKRTGHRTTRSHPSARIPTALRVSLLLGLSPFLLCPLWQLGSMVSALRRRARADAPASRRYDLPVRAASGDRTSLSACLREGNPRRRHKLPVRRARSDTPCRSPVPSSDAWVRCADVR